jgi:hypothetical protein
MNLKSLFWVGAVAAGFAVGAAPASAYISCNREGGDCWHSESRVTAPGVRLEHHPDDWYFHQKWENNNDRHYRDYHEGRGYYRGGVWITL